MTVMAIFARSMSTAPAILTPQSGGLLHSPIHFHLKIMHAQSRRQAPATAPVCRRRGHETRSPGTRNPDARPDSIVGMEFFQFTGEMGNPGALPVVRRALAANISGAMYDVVPSPAHECQRRRRGCGPRRGSALWLLYLAGFLGSEKIESHESSFPIDVGGDWEAQFLSSHPAFKPAGRLGWQCQRFAMVFLRVNRLNF